MNADYENHEKPQDLDLDAKSASLTSVKDFERLKYALQKEFALKLDGYRDEYLLRRLSYHQKKCGAKTVDEYLKRLQDQKLINELLDTISINVSYFFRDLSSFEYLKKNIVPELYARFPIVRTWSMGCSIGAEIYSIAMILHSLNLLSKSDLLASDNDPSALQRAIRGEFGSRELKTLPEEYKRYFANSEQSSQAQQINAEIIKSVKFQQHDLTSCEPILKLNQLRRYHLLVCRNVMIYFGQGAKQDLFEAFYDWLEPGGILFIGASEMIIGPSKDKFERIDNQFFRRPL